VTDDGRGIDPARFAAAVGEGHIGVAAMIERIEAVDGTVEFRTVATAEPGVAGGTTVTVSLPAAAAV
ncbi:MAG: hypothetical protein REI11_10690, partial [Patulibacter sp.]|nr:hypothetical protein [Patulibacter sp.]